MKINQGIAIATDAVLLVPYEAHHVPRYHSWMQDPDIREATASEELGLVEEFENQVSWRQAHDKLTFILCRPSCCRVHGDERGKGNGDEAEDEVPHIIAGREDAEERMLGDVNFFLYSHDDDDDDDDDDEEFCWGDEGNGRGGHDGDDRVREVLVRGEVDVMVAERDARGKGIGTAAVRALSAFVDGHLEALLEEYAAGESGRWDACARRKRANGGGMGTEKLRLRMVGLMAKIKEGNEGSLSLFRGLGFQQEGGVDYFGEVKMVLPWDRGVKGGVASRRWGEGAARLGYRELRYEVDMKA